jgi:hypothetical protein
MRPCYWVSDGPSCAAWTGPCFIDAPGSLAATEEWDVAELAGGALLGVIRTRDHRRAQVVLERQQDGWAPGVIVPAPIPFSGQPELLVTREGPILHIASNGIWATSDRGASWRLIQEVAEGTWYPSAVQLEDGLVLSASHIGSDDPYGAGDQAIVLDSFRLDVGR